MEKQKLGSTPNEAPKKKKAYCEPKLSLISFKPEEGFANSAPVPGVTITQMDVITRDDSSWI